MSDSLKDLLQSAFQAFSQHQNAVGMKFLKAALDQVEGSAITDTKVIAKNKKVEKE